MSYWVQLGGGSQGGSQYSGPDRKEPLFSGSGSDGVPPSSVGEFLHSGESPVGATHPDPLTERILQEFSIEQGVGGSKSGPAAPGAALCLNGAEPVCAGRGSAICIVREGGAKQKNRG